jgi:hypothetical protein
MSIYVHGSDDGHHIFSQHLQIEAYDLTYASCSFEVILNQALYQLGGYNWAYGDPIFTIEGIQQTINVWRGRSGPPLSVVSKPCERYCEAKESVLVHTLRYICDILGYEMNDLHFSEYVVKHHRVLGM